MALVGYIGAVGSGKTFNMVKDGIEAAHKRDAWLVSNITITPPREYGLVTLKLTMGHDGIDLDALRVIVNAAQERGKGIELLIDEVGILMPARFWQNFPIDLMFYLSQSRKLRANFKYSAQDAEQVDAILRRLTWALWLCRTFPSSERAIERMEAGRRPYLFLMSKWKPAALEKARKKPIGRAWRRYDRVAESWYDTDELVMPPAAFRNPGGRRRRRTTEEEAERYAQLVEQYGRQIEGAGPEGEAGPIGEAV